MRILWVATKSPWPPTDGGRLLLKTTLEGLHAAGHRVELVSPFPPRGATEEGEVVGGLSRFCVPHLVRTRPVSYAWSMLRAGQRGLPIAVARHRSDPVRQRVASVLRDGSFDAIVSEQLHALPQCEPGFERGLPVVLRAQNVESAVWGETARSLRLGATLAAREARRLSAWEGAAIRRVALTVALTDRDAATLAALAGGAGRLEVVPAPFPAELPPGEPLLPGDPPLVVMGAHAWRPNRDGARWFARAIWPELSSAIPGAVLHLFGGPSGVRGPRIVRHAPPRESAEAFAPGSILVVPLRVASGVRMKILEAWARGVPVVSTPEAAAGLEGTGAWLEAGDGAGFLAAVRALQSDSSRRALVEAGRSVLRRRHDPVTVARCLVELLTRVA